MVLKLFGIRIVIDFSFFLLLSFAVLYGYDNVAYVLLFSCLHEAGHLLSLLLFKVKPYEIKASFYGISLKFSNSLGVFKEVVVILCGPAVNLLLYLLLGDNVNLFLFAINMYPLLPLDGGRLVYLLSKQLYKYLSVLSIAVLTLLSIYMFVEFKVVSLLFVAVYLLIFNVNQRNFI